MTPLIEIGDSILISNDDRATIQRFADSMGGSDAMLNLELNDALPEELKQILRRVIHGLADGQSVSISVLPAEVTTTTAAALLDVSRPTVMKYIKNGQLSAHKVGTHHRLETQQVLELLEKLKQQQRDAVFALLEVEEAAQ